MNEYLVKILEVVYIVHDQSHIVKNIFIYHLDDLTVSSRIYRSLIRNNIGHAWYQKGNYIRALDWFNLALAIQQQEPELPYQIAMTINNKGVLHMMAGEWRLALDAFRDAVSIQTKIKNYDDLAAALQNMGTVKSQVGEYDEALSLYQKSSEALKAAGIPDYHLEVAELKMKIAFVYRNQAKWSDALDVLYKVKEIREQILPISHVDMGRTLFTIGIVLRSQERYDEAFDHMKQALAIYQHVYSFGHPNIANTYNSMANLKAVQNQENDALLLYEQAMEQFRSFYCTDEHFDIARVLNNMGQAHRHLGNLSEALDCLQRALKMRQNTLGINHPDTATTWVNLGLVYQAKGDLKTALENVKHALDIRRVKLQQEHEDLVVTEALVVHLEQEIHALDQTLTSS